MQQPVVRLLRLQGLPILRQLQLEEAMLRAHDGNWCLLNDGVPEPTVVMGISSKPEHWVNLEAARSAHVSLIRRYSGGGTVVVDAGTLFATLVMAGESAVPGVQCYPRPLMAWSEQLYRPVFGPYGDFRLRDNDYVFGERKFGGNAQAITRGRWVHHTSFLWDYQPDLMQVLRHPPKMPEYRQDRDHGDFLCRLKDVVMGPPHREMLFDELPKSLQAMGFQLQDATLQEAELLLERDYLRNTHAIEL